MAVVGPWRDTRLRYWTAGGLARRGRLWATLPDRLAEWYPTPDWINQEIGLSWAHFPFDTPSRATVVLRGDPGSPGTILATVAIPEHGNEVTMATVSKRQRDLAMSIFGAPAPVAQVSSCAGLPSLSMPSEHCVGIPRNQFVPLGNELTNCRAGRG